MSSQGLSLTEAAAYLGIAERTLRSRIKEGKVRADKVIGPKGGAVYRVYLDDPCPDPGPDPQPSNRPPDPDPQPDPGLAELVAHVRELERRLEQYAGQIGFLSAQLQTANEKIALLEAPAQRSNGSGEPQNGAVWASETASEPGSGADPADPSVEPTESASAAQPATEAATTGNGREEPNDGQRRPWWAFWKWGTEMG